jgi:hypothetical protein
MRQSVSLLVSALAMSLVGLSLGALRPRPAEAAGLPSVLAEWPTNKFAVKPATITPGEFEIIGGFDGNGRTNFGHIDWSSWTNTEASGSGAYWLTSPSGQPAREDAVSVGASAPSGGHFTRLTLHYTDRGVARTDTLALRRNAISWYWQQITQPTGPCVDQVSMGLLIAKGCLVAGSNGVYTVSGALRINGIDFKPSSGGTLTLDSKRRHLLAAGAGTVYVGAAAVSGWSSGLDLALDTLPLRLGAGGGIVQQKVGPRTRKFFGFPLSSELDVSFGPDATATLNATLDLSVLGDGVQASLTVQTSNEKGLVSARGSVGRGSKFGGSGQLCSATKPAPLGFDCVATSSGGQTLFRLKPSDGQVVRLLGKVPVEDLTLTYRSEGSEWDLEGTVSLGQLFPSHGSWPSLIIGAGVQTSPFAFNYIKGGFSDFDLPLPFPPATDLTKFALAVRIHPHFQLAGQVGLAVGKEIDHTRLLGIDGDFTLELPGDGFKLDVDGTVQLLDKLQLAHGYVKVETKAGGWNIGFGGNVGFSFGPASINGSVNGSIAPPHFQALGDVSANVFGQGVSGHGVLSDAGVGACGTFQVAWFSGEVGFKHFWNTGDTDFNGCDFGGLYTVGHAADVSGAPTSVTLRPGLAQAEIAAVGVSAAPMVTLVGPQGETFSTPPVTDRISQLSSGQGLAVAVTSSRTTYFIIKRPTAGSWRLVPASGSAPLARVELADPLRPYAVTSRVSGTGRQRRLTWRFPSQRGESVELEQTGGTDRSILTTTRPTGSTTFPIAAGPGGRRHVVALISIDGFLRQRVTVASFRAPKPSRPRVKRASYAIRPGRLIISWRPVRAASFYDITVRIRRGALRFELVGPRRSLVARVGSRAYVRAVTVTSVVDGITGPPVRAKRVRA